jgi:hypothetical protein
VWNGQADTRNHNKQESFMHQEFKIAVQKGTCYKQFSLSQGPSYVCGGYGAGYGAGYAS